MKGEHIVDDTVWIVKTHSPWLMPEAPVFHCNRLVCIVRSPIDVLISFLQLFTCGSHSQKAPFEYYEKYPQFWDWFIKTWSPRLGNWYRCLMHDARLKELPVLFVRFEDLVVNPEPQLRNIMMFLNNMTDLTGTNAERRVLEVIAKGKDATVVYSLKDNTRSLATNHKRYTKEQMSFIENEMKDVLYYFGYVKHESDPESYTQFHEFKDPNPELAKTYNCFKQLNQQSIEWNASLTDPERAQIQFMNSNPDKAVQVLEWAEGNAISGPMRHDA